MVIAHCPCSRCTVQCWCRGSCTACTIHRVHNTISLWRCDTLRVFVSAALCTDRRCCSSRDASKATRTSRRAARHASGSIRSCSQIAAGALRRRWAPRLHVSHRVGAHRCKTTAFRPPTLCMIRVQQAALLQQTVLCSLETADCRVTLRLHMLHLLALCLLAASGPSSGMIERAMAEGLRCSIVSNLNITCNVCRERPAAAALIVVHLQYNAIKRRSIGDGISTAVRCMQLTSGSHTAEKGHAAACLQACLHQCQPVPFATTNWQKHQRHPPKSYHRQMSSLRRDRAAPGRSMPRAFTALLPSLLLLLAAAAAPCAAAAAGGGAAQERRAVWQHARADIQAVAAQLPVHVDDGRAAADAAPRFGIAMGAGAAVGAESSSGSTGHGSNGSSVAPASLQRLRRSLQARRDAGRPASGGITGAGSDAGAWAALTAMDPAAAEALQGGHGRALLARGVNSETT